MNIAKIMTACIFIIACITLVGCEDNNPASSDNTVFVNNSTSTVTVRPSGDETFAQFTLAPGNKKSVQRVGESIDYTFTATGKVFDTVIGKIEVSFSDSDLSIL